MYMCVCMSTFGYGISTEKNMKSSTRSWMMCGWWPKWSQVLEGSRKKQTKTKNNVERLLKC